MPMAFYLAPLIICFLLVLLKLKMAEVVADITLTGDACLKNNFCPTATELSDYLKSSVKDVLSSVTDEKFVFLYKTCYKEFEKKTDIARPALSGSSNEGKKYHSQFKEMIIRSTTKTIEETVLDMNSKLKEIEELKSAQSETNVFWRPPGNALKHIIPFEFVSELEKKKELEVKIAREQKALEILKDRLNQKRNKAKELHEVLLTLIEDIKHIVTSKVENETLQGLTIQKVKYDDIKESNF